MLLSVYSRWSASYLSASFGSATAELCVLIIDSDGILSTWVLFCQAFFCAPVCDWTLSICNW